MAHSSAEVFIVLEKDLKNPKKMPIGVLRWVERYFEKRNIFGQPCYVAFGTQSLQEYYREPDGAAVTYLGSNEYSEGLPEGVKLIDWVRSRRNVFFSYSKSWQDGTIEPCGDPYED